jgi:hypothetical protein
MADSFGFIGYKKIRAGLLGGLNVHGGWKFHGATSFLAGDALSPSVIACRPSVSRGGGSLTFTQKTPICFTACMNSLKSTGFTT